MNLKPIEPGCRAVIYNSKVGHNGKVVTVVECLGRKPPPQVVEDGVIEFKETSIPIWRIDRFLSMRLLNRQTGRTRYLLLDLIGENNLMRIDGHKSDEEDVITRKLSEVV